MIALEEDLSDREVVSRRMKGVLGLANLDTDCRLVSFAAKVFPYTSRASILEKS